MRETYLAIDLKSFYASVECVERGLDPLTTNLVVADESRTDKTICLAVSPSLKAYGIPGRARLFEVKEKLRQVKASTGKEVEFLIAPPRMQHYIDMSARIYQIYLKYVSREDIHVYSIDEVFMDVTHYMSLYHNPDGSLMTGRDLARKMIQDILIHTGITATAGVGTNLYLAKIAMDIVAKHVTADREGVRIAQLDEMDYRRLLWNHRPLTSFWRIGRGISRRLESYGMYTMGDVARESIQNEDLLFQLFGVDAELLIDHAWGLEPCKMTDIKNYKPENHSVGSGQVLGTPYSKEKGRLVLAEMLDTLALDLVQKGLVTDQIVIHIGYDKDVSRYSGPIHVNHYGIPVPKPAHGSRNLDFHTSSSREICKAGLSLYDDIVNPDLLVHRLTVSFQHVIPESEVDFYFQYDLFTDPEDLERRTRELKRERSMQEAVIRIKRRYGKNAILKGMNLEEGATAIERNQQIGGHKA